MTKEEAIAVFNSLAIEMTAILAGIPKSESEAKQIQRYIDAYDMAISALRQQETVTDRHELNEPLTLDELRKMDGEPVWLEFPNDGDGHWDLIAFCNSEFLSTYRSGYLLLEEYGKTWLAYRQKPEEGTV